MGNHSSKEGTGITPEGSDGRGTGTRGPKKSFDIFRKKDEDTQFQKKRQKYSKRITELQNGENYKHATIHVTDARIMKIVKWIENNEHRFNMATSDYNNAKITYIEKRKEITQYKSIDDNRAVGQISQNLHPGEFQAKTAFMGAARGLLVELERRLPSSEAGSSTQHS